MLPADMVLVGAGIIYQTAQPFSPRAPSHSRVKEESEA